MKWTDMLRRRLRTVVIPLTAAVVTTAIFSLPQAMHYLRGNDSVVVLHYDEPDYVARFVRALQGRAATSPWTLEHRADPGIVPSYVESSLAAPFRLSCAMGVGCASAGPALLFYRILLPFVGVLILCWAMCAAGMPPALAALAAFCAYCEPGLGQYQPFIGLIRQQSILPFDRFSNPLVGLPVFFAAWALLAATLKGQRSWRWSVCAGSLAGALFYVSVYYWTHFVAAAAVALALQWSRPRARTIAIVLGTAAIVSIPYWTSVVDLRSNPFYMDIPWRNGLLIHDRIPSAYSNKTMWMFVVGAAVLWVQARETSRFLVASIVGGLACFYSSLITGIALQNAHWNYTLAPMLLAACLWAGSLWLRTKGFANQRGMGAVIAVLVVGLSVRAAARWYRASESGPLPGAGADQPYHTAWSWLRAHAPPDSVVLASEQTMGYVPLRTGLYAWFNAHIGTEAVGFEEILERYQVLWSFDGTDAMALERRMCGRIGRGVLGWDYGLTAELTRELVAEGRPPFETPLVCRLAHNLGELHARLRPEDVRRMGRKYRVDFIVRGPNESHWNNLRDYVSMTPAFDEGGVRVDRVGGWIAEASADAGQ